MKPKIIEFFVAPRNCKFRQGPVFLGRVPYRICSGFVHAHRQRGPDQPTHCHDEFFVRVDSGKPHGLLQRVVHVEIPPHQRIL